MSNIVTHLAALWKSAKSNRQRIEALEKRLEQLERCEAARRSTAFGNIDGSAVMEALKAKAF